MNQERNAVINHKATEMSAPALKVITFTPWELIISRR